MTTIKQRAQQLRSWMKKYERFIVPVALVSGFLFDSQIFTRVDLLWNDLLLLAYLLIAAVGIILFHLGDEHALHNWVTKTIAAVMPITVQFAFGSLFKGLIIFYSGSASLATSWIFVVVLAAVLIASEVFITSYRRFRYQISIWFFLLLAYNAFYLPVVVGDIGPVVFLESVALSIAILILFISLLRTVLPKRIKRTRGFLIRMAIGISCIFITLYALNWIPPLPLALKDASVAHAVSRTGDVYTLSVEPRTWWEWYAQYHAEYHYTSGEGVYVYSAVFAPTKLSTTISHEWQHYDISTEKWVTTNTVVFPINGGRDGGYRAYSVKRNLSSGQWRVNVKTSYGAIISRITFDAIPASTTAATISEEH